MKDLRIKPRKGYERNVANNIGFGEVPKLSMQEIQAGIRAYTLKEGTTMRDIKIPGPEEGVEIGLHIITPANLPEKAPVVMDIHGGGWVSGDVGIDNYRNIQIAENTPCIVVAVEYRLASETVHFPVPLNDCICAFQWIYDHAEEIGGDREKLGLHGTSAGGNLVGGLILYNRDHGGILPKLAVLNCPALTMDTTDSKNILGGMGTAKNYAKSPEALYCGSTDKKDISYYAMPAYCNNLNDLPPCSLIVGEYDPLRSETVEFATRLMNANVPCELVVAPRVSHGFCTVDAPLTHWVHEGICASFRREFDMD